jgi:hypothetical protein
VLITSVAASQTSLQCRRRPALTARCPGRARTPHLPSNRRRSFSSSIGLRSIAHRRAPAESPLPFPGSCALAAGHWESAKMQRLPSPRNRSSSSSAWVCAAFLTDAHTQGRHCRSRKALRWLLAAREARGCGAHQALGDVGLHLRRVYVAFLTDAHTQGRHCRSREALCWLLATEEARGCGAYQALGGCYGSERVRFVSDSDSS